MEERTASVTALWYETSTFLFWSVILSGAERLDRMVEKLLGTEIFTASNFKFA